jgi:outer membrane protein TolC
MTERFSVRFATLAALATVLFLGVPSPASAQMSEERLKELIREAERAAQETRLFDRIKTPDANGPVQALTLDEAVARALENNLDLKVQRLNPQLSDISITSARTVYIPTLTGNLAQSSQQSAATSQLQVGTGGGGVLSRTMNYNVQVNQQVLWGGGALAVNLTNSRQSSNSNNANYNPQYNSTWTAQYTQPLLRDFNIDGQRRTLQISKINRETSDVQLRATITNTVSNVRNAYWDYVYAVQAVEAAQMALDLAAKLVEDNRTRVEVGTMAPIDITQAEAELATRRQNKITADNTKQTSENALKRLIVAGTTDPLWDATIDPTDRPEFRPEPIDIAAATRRAISERTDLEVARKNIEANQITVGYLKNQTLPSLDLTGSYGVQGVGGTRFVRSNTGVLGSTITQEIPGGVTDALGSLFRNENPRWTVGLALTYPIGISAQHASLARARVQLNQVALQIQQIELQIAIDIRNAVIQAQNAAAAVEASQAALQLSERRLEAEQSKFEVGMSTNFNVVQAQRDLNDARVSQLRQVLNYRRALVELDRLQQTATSTQGITIIN